MVWVSMKMATGVVPRKAVSVKVRSSGRGDYHSKREQKTSAGFILLLGILMIF